MASFSVKRRARNRLNNDARKLVHEKINVVYEDFNDGKITLLNSYKQTLENKLEKFSTINEEISNILGEVEDYQSEIDVAMETELKIRESLENLRTFLSAKSKSPTHSLPRTDETSRQFTQAKLPKSEIKPFSGNPVQWKAFIDSLLKCVVWKM